MQATIISIAISILLIGGAIFFTRSGSSSNQTAQVENIQNVSIVGGKQIIEIKAKGGYIPRESIAKAGMPTILRFNTNGTFDCSAAVRIPSLDISKILANSGETDIDLGTPSLGILQGICGMGMYNFSINFK